MENENICNLCLQPQDDQLLQKLHGVHKDSTSYLRKLLFSFPDMKDVETNSDHKICSQCIRSLNTAFEFRKILNNNFMKYKNVQIMQIKEEFHCNNNGSNIKMEIEEESVSMVQENVTKFVATTQVSNHSEKDSNQCEYCDKVFKFKSKLNRHLRSHTGERPYICLVCNRGFSQKNDLTIHVKKHTGEKLLLCHFCNKTFLDMSDLCIHIKMHTTEEPIRKRPYPCTACDKSFIQKCHLDAHLRLHTGDRPFKCKDCGKLFNKKYHLGVHARTHFQRKPEYSMVPQHNKAV